MEILQKFLYIWLLLYIGIVFAIRYLYKKKRSKELQLAAQSLGHYFEKRGALTLNSALVSFPYFLKGMGKRLEIVYTEPSIVWM
jgi:hypothetical protein